MLAQPSNTRRISKIYLIFIILCIVTIVASELQDTVSDEVLTSSIALNNSLNQVFRHICIICQQLLRIFRQAVTAARCQVLDNFFHK